MRGRLKIMFTIVMVFALVIIGSMGSFALAKDMVQSRDRDCIDEPNHQYCDKELIDCDQDQDRLRQRLMDCDDDQDPDWLRKCLMDWENNCNQLRLRHCFVRILLMNYE